MPERPPEASRTFGKYRILDRLAVGGMAEIYKARLDGEGGFHRTFALKRILPHLGSRPEFVDMLVEEAKIAGLLSHANIVQIMDLGEVDGTWFIAMEYVEGPDLGRILRRCKQKGITLPVPHAVFAIIEVLKALEYAHHRRVLRGGKEVPLDIVHRDVSPANVLVSFQGEVKLTDFGIAKASIKALETVSGVIKGRFDYLAPEQAAGERPDARADLFTTGVVLYECLAGKHPFRRRSEAETLEAIRDARYEPPSAVNPDVPYALEVVLERALARDPADRYQTATEMKSALDRFFHDAGFIFSHSTLAAFLKGLFPEEAGRARRPGAVEVEAHDPLTTDETQLVGPSHRPTESLTDELLPEEQLPGAGAGDEARPTEAYTEDVPVPSPDEPFPSGDSTLRKPRAGLVARAPDLPAGPGSVAGFGEEATLIRPQPVPTAAAPRGLSAPEDWGEAETVIKPEPPTLVRRPGPPRAAPAQATPAHAAPAQSRPAPPSPAPHPSAQPRTAAPGPSPAGRGGSSAGDTTGRRRAAPRGSAWRIHVLYLALVVVSSVAMLFFGVWVTRSRLLAAAPTAAPVVRHEPQLRVLLPEGGELVVDGRPVPGPAPIDLVLSADEPHRVEVQVPGYNPYETRLTLGPNEVRVLSVQVDCLQPNRR